MQGIIDTLTPSLSAKCLVGRLDVDKVRVIAETLEVEEIPISIILKVENEMVSEVARIEGLKNPQEFTDKFEKALAPPEPSSGENDEDN